MTLKKLILTLVILAIPSIAKAQTLPSPRIEWDYLAIQLAVVNTYTQVVTIDGVTITGTKVCAQSAVGVTCYVGISAPTPGVHAVRVVATANGQSATGNTSITVLGNGPNQPSNTRYIVNITVTVP